MSDKANENQDLTGKVTAPKEPPPADAIPRERAKAAVAQHTRHLVRGPRVTIAADQLLRLRQLGPGDEVAPELLPAATVVMGRAGYATKAGTYSWTAEGGWETTDPDSPGQAPANYPLAIAVETLIVAWDLLANDMPGERLPQGLRQQLAQLEHWTERPGWQERLRAQAARLHQIGRAPDEPLPPWQPSWWRDPLSPETLIELGEALANPGAPSTEGHRRTLIQARRLLDEIRRLWQITRPPSGSWQIYTPKPKPPGALAEANQIREQARAGIAHGGLIPGEIVVSRCTEDSGVGRWYLLVIDVRWPTPGESPGMTEPEQQQLAGGDPTTPAPSDEPGGWPPGGWPPGRMADPAPPGAYSNTAGPPLSADKMRIEELLAALPRCEDCGDPATRIGSDGDERDALCLCDGCRPGQRLWEVETPLKATIDGMAEPVVRWAPALRALKSGGPDDV
jgi:hypothetical protein